MKKIYLSMLICLLFSSELFSQCTVNGFATSPACVDSCNGRIRAFTFGGTAPYTYTWSNGDTTATITGLCAGTYTVTVKDAGTCDMVRTFTVTPATPLTDTVTVVNERCYGGAGGAATVTPRGGAAPYTYSWNTAPVQTTRTARNLPPGTYTVTVTSTGGCTTTGTATITQPPQLVANSSSTNSACDSSTGSAIVTVSGGTGHYTYSWNTIPASTTSSVTGLSSGVYTVTVRDSLGCTVTSTDVVGNASGLSATATQTNITCRGSANGTAILIPTGGTLPYTYSWSSTPVQTTDTATGLIAGTYTGTVTDSGGCSFAAKVTITQPPTGITVIVRPTNVTCFGDSNGIARTLVNGGTAPYSYSWSTTPVQTTAIATNLAAGTYTVTVSDINSCTASRTVTIIAPTTAVSATITTTNVTCFGAGNASATVNAAGGTPGYTYLWSNGMRTRAITNLAVGTYSVVVTDRAGCTTADSVVITRPAQIIIAITVDSASCGVSNGAATATITSGGVSPFTYHWIPAGGAGSTATGIPAGVYEILVTDANGCTSTASAAVPNAGAGTAVISSHKNVSCRRGADGTAIVTMTGGVSPYAYSWNTTPVQTTDTATGLAAGTYGVTVTDANGCLSDATVIITQPATIVVSTTTHTNVACNGDSTGTATVNAIGGTPPYSYSWNSTPVQTTKTALDLKAITYVVTVTDSNGCTSTSTAIIRQPPAMTLSTTEVNVTCNAENNGAASVTVTGGTAPFTYSWTTTPVQTTRTITGLMAGTYSVTVTEATGCTATAFVSITQANPIVLNTSSTNTTCGTSNGTATVGVTSGGTGPFTYSWTTTPVQTTATATGLPANSYSVTVVDSKGCSATASIIVSSTNAAIATVTVKNATCYGESNGAASVSMSGGTAPFTYAWTTTPIQTSDTATGLTAGSYGVIVTDHSGCLTPANAVVGQPDSLIAVNTVTNVSCAGGDNGAASAVISGGNGGYTYSWNTTPVQITDTATGLIAGNFVLSVTDSKGCMLTDAITVSQPGQSLIVSASQLQSTCSGSSNGLATATVSGGNPPYSYSWNTSPVQHSDTASGLAAGTYTVTVTDLLGCSNTATATISGSAPITATITPTNVTCFGYANGSDSLSNVSGGSQPYTYSWNSTPVQTSEVATTLPAGIYTVTITDLNGCTANYTNTIAQPEAAVTLTIATANATCDSINGKISASVTGGTGPYTYIWNTVPVQTADTATGLTAGNYIVTVTDVNGCMNTDQGTIANEGAGRDSITSVTNVSCYNGNNGSATITVIGGSQPFTYSWNTTPVQTGATASNLTANSYIVTVTDANGCKSSENVFISQPSPIVSLTSFTDIKCFGGGATGSVSVSTNGGNPPYSVSWNTTPVQTTDTAVNLGAGVYTVTVTDASGCSATATAVISQPQQITAAVTQTPVFCNGGSDGSGSVFPNGGTAPYTFAWSTNPVQDSSTAVGLSAGVYHITITDLNGCTATVKDSITQPVPIDLNPSSTKTTSCGLANGTASVTVVSGGVFPFTYLWLPSGATTRVDSNLSAGVDTVYVTDSNGCTDSAYAVVGSIGAGNPTPAQVNDSCFGDNNGLASVMVSGGTPPFTYLWNTVPAQTADTATGLAAGTYNVVIFDAAGCNIDVLIVITEPPAITFTDTVSYATCGGCSDGSAKVYPSGGTPPYTYSWSTLPVQTTQKATNLSPGVYNFCITDANNCSVCDTVTVGISAVGILNLSSQSDTKMIVYPNPSSGQFTLEFSNAQSQDLTVNIVNIVGQEIYSEKIIQADKISKTYNLADYPKGMYLIQVITDKKVYIGRIILE